MDCLPTLLRNCYSWLKDKRTGLMSTRRIKDKTPAITKWRGQIVNVSVLKVSGLWWSLEAGKIANLLTNPLTIAVGELLTVRRQNNAGIVYHIHSSVFLSIEDPP